MQTMSGHRPCACTRAWGTVLEQGSVSARVRAVTRPTSSHGSGTVSTARTHPLRCTRGARGPHNTAPTACGSGSVTGRRGARRLRADARLRWPAAHTPHERDNTRGAGVSPWARQPGTVRQRRVAYQGVPTNVMRDILSWPHDAPRSMVAATPKSASFTAPSLSTKMLPACGGGTDVAHTHVCASGPDSPVAPVQHWLPSCLLISTACERSSGRPGPFRPAGKPPDRSAPRGATPLPLCKVA